MEDFDFDVPSYLRYEVVMPPAAGSYRLGLRYATRSNSDKPCASSSSAECATVKLSVFIGDDEGFPPASDSATIVR